MCCGCQRQSGSALVYVLIGIALMAALTVSFMEPSSEQSQSQNAFRIASALNGQVSLIQSAIQECAISYPGGDPNVNDVTATDPDWHAPFPLRPNSPHLTDSYDPAADGDASTVSNRPVGALRCPGNPGGGDPDHAAIFGGASGRFMPPRPPLLKEWEYYNGIDGVFIWISTDKSDPYLRAAFDKLDARYSTCEADVIDQRSSGGDQALVSDISAPNDDVLCQAGHLCFRYWLILEDTAVHLDTGCP